LVTFDQKNWQIFYFNETVQKDIEKWPSNLLAKYIKITALIEDFGPHLDAHLTKPLGGGLFEIRVKAKEGIGRAFFCYQTGSKIVILHAFIKKTQKTSQRELKLALKRLKEIKHG